MATVIKARVNSSRGTAYEVFLDNGAPSSDGLLLDSKGSNIDFKLNSQDPDGHIMASKASVQFQITNSTEKAVFDGLIQANELQYRLRIHRGGVLEWVGFVLLEQVNSDFGGYPYFFKVGATDGLSRLKDIDYDQGALGDFATIKEHLFNILGQVPLADYFATSAEYLRINSTLYPEGMTPGTTVNTLEKIRLGFKALRTVDNKGEVTYVSQYDALLEVMKALNARIIFSKGRYVVTEINSYARALTATTFFRYDQQGTALTPETQTTWIPATVQIGSDLATDDAVALSGGKVTHLPPLKAVDLTYKHYSRQNLLPGYTWTEGFTTTAQLANFRSNGGAGTLLLNGGIDFLITPDGSPREVNGAIYLVIGVRIILLDDGTPIQGLSRRAIITPAGLAYSEVEWTAGANNYEIAFPAPPPQAERRVSQSFSLVTPPIPDEGTLSLDFVTVKYVDKNNDAITDVSIDYDISNVFLESLLTGSISDQYNFTNFRPETGASGFNSVVLERETLFGDGPDENTFGRIEYTENGEDWEPTYLWRRWSGGNYLNTVPMRHGTIISRMILALQESPREQLDITVIAPTYYPEYMLGCDDKLYLMKSGRLDLDRDEWRGRWFEIAANFVDSTVVGTDHETDPVTGTGDGGASNEPDLPLVGGGGYVSPSTGDSPGNTAPAINTVTTTTGEDILIEDGEIGNLPVDNLTDVPLFAGDIITLTNPATGETMDVEVAHDSGYIVGDMLDPGAIPYYTAAGTVWLVPSATHISIVPITPTSDFPADSYIQPNAQSAAQIQGVLRVAHKDAHLFGYDETIVVGDTDWFWRPERRKGEHIRKVHFAFAQDMGGTVKVNLKYYDATGFRYTIATYNGGGLGGVETALADILEGYYRIQVESFTVALPKGLTVFIEYIKTRD